MDGGEDFPGRLPVSGGRSCILVVGATCRIKRKDKAAAVAVVEAGAEAVQEMTSVVER